LDKLIHFLERKGIDKEEAHHLQEKFERALENLTGHGWHHDHQADSGNDSNEHSVYLPKNRYQPRAKKQGKRRLIFNTFKAIVALLIIMLGFAMIILPTPSSFEIYTLFYFNEQDGFTLMDLISLLIIFAGIYVLLTSVYTEYDDKK
jgi:hypothetical protein